MMKYSLSSSLTEMRKHSPSSIYGVIIIWPGFLVSSSVRPHHPSEYRSKAENGAGQFWSSLYEPDDITSQLPTLLLGRPIGKELL